MDLLLDWGASLINAFLGLKSFFGAEVTFLGYSTTVGGIVIGGLLATLITYKLFKFVFGWVDILT